MFTNSFHLHRSIIVLPEQKKRIVVRNVKSVNDNIRFVIELKSTHRASNLNTRLWTKIDRSVIGNATIPVRAIFGLETRNLQHQPVEYSLETRTDAIKFTEIQLKSPNSMLKARIDKINDNHYKVGFYENNQQPSIVGELNLNNNGAIFEYRNEKLQEIKLHASAEKFNDYEGEINVWHSEESKKIQDARLALQKKTKEIMSKSGEFHQNSFIPDVFRSIFLSHKQIANDIVTTALDEIIKQWTTEQR
ncbi:unnamed protein product [Wuchereria bancrofti]|uniref:Uncharacterized protein n=1 Tax=Wuchereria bancrofti TaxID=6293 RepID=A0A3P7FQH7_WUCBA|nr:unnamed protein product [Wuchereria bancrofti]